MTAVAPVDVGRVLAIPGVERCVVLGQVGSALDVLEGLAAEGAPHGTLVVADEQLAGRGRHGRAWHSPVGGLWLAFLARPAEPPEPGAFALRVSLEVAAGLASIGDGPGRLAIKWPNDIYVAERKAGGILCEASWIGQGLRWIAVGIGLNLTNPIPEALRDQAVALGHPSRTDALEAILPGLLAVRDASPCLTPAECERFAQMDWLRGRSLVEPAVGTADGISSDGQLRVMTEAGVRHFRDGPVRLA